jgi:hypothetical protein
MMSAVCGALVQDAEPGAPTLTQLRHGFERLCASEGVEQRTSLAECACYRCFEVRILIYVTASIVSFAGGCECPATHGGLAGRGKAKTGLRIRADMQDCGAGAASECGSGWQIFWTVTACADMADPTCGWHRTCVRVQCSRAGHVHGGESELRLARGG